MLRKTIKYTSLFVMLITISACSNLKKEPADDGYDTRAVNGGEGWGTEAPDVKKQFLNKKIAQVFSGKKKASKRDEEIRARLERLENQQNGNVQAQPQPQIQAQPAPAITNSNDITAPPTGSTRPSPRINTSPNTGSNWQSSASFQEWKRAKEGGSSDYREFQEYKEWLEFQKLKKQNQ